MAPSDKIEPRLLKEIFRLESAGQRDVRIPVVIQHAQALGPLGREGEPALDKASEDLALASRRDLLKRLGGMGTGQDIQRLELANAIETHLTAAQIREIAAHPDVKNIIWNREEHVTA